MSIYMFLKSKLSSYCLIINNEFLYKIGYLDEVKMKNLRKYIVLFITFLFIIVNIAGIFIGDYFVDFAFHRSNDADFHGMPKASAIIVSPDAKPVPKPEFSNRICTITADNGEKRNATLFMADNMTHNYIILVHGYCRNQEFFWDYADCYLKAGYNVLTPDLNASGTSDGEYLTMGSIESDDIVAWSKELVKTDSNAKIVLHGISMGAATVMMATAKDLPDNVVAAVEDCGYTSAYSMFTEQLEKNYDLPRFPVMNYIDLMSRVKTGCFLSNANPLEAVSKTKIPMLFIHGNQDKLVPLHMEDMLYEASKAPVKKKIVVDGAGHADSMYVYGDKYFQNIFDFVGAYL